MIRPMLIVGLVLGLGAVPRLAFAQEGVASELERTASTTPQEKVQYASTANQEMRDAVKHVTKLLDGARRESDVEGLQCLTNRLTSIRALLQVSEGAELAMKDALGSGEAEKANHEFRKIAVALSKSRQLMAEAERCAAQDTTLASGDSSIRVEGGIVGVDPSEDTGGLDIDVFEIGFDPPDASPFL